MRITIAIIVLFLAVVYLQEAHKEFMEACVKDAPQNKTLCEAMFWK